MAQVALEDTYSVLSLAVNLLTGSLPIALYTSLQRATPQNLPKSPTLHTDLTGQTYTNKVLQQETLSH